MRRPPPDSPLFPYTTLFRSQLDGDDGEAVKKIGAKGARGDAGGEVDMGRRDDADVEAPVGVPADALQDRKSTRLNSSHRCISYAVFCLKKKKTLARTYDNND